MKKLIIYLLCCVVLVSMVGCGGNTAPLPTERPPITVITEPSIKTTPPVAAVEPTEKEKEPVTTEREEQVTEPTVVATEPTTIQPTEETTTTATSIVEENATPPIVETVTSTAPQLTESETTETKPPKDKPKAETEPPKVTEPDPTENPAPFDIDHWIAYARSYAESKGLVLSDTAVDCWDNPIKEALSRNRSEGNVYFITDEFKLLPYLSHIDDAVNFGRSLGIKFMVGVQNVEQIYDNYGEERARSILSGFMTSICFRVNDAKSREYIQGLFGKNQKIETYMPTIQNRGMIETQREANVVEDWDITRLKIGEAIIGLPGYEPFVFQFDRYKER